LVTVINLIECWPEACYGNSGNDLFVFANGDGDDIIMDFTAGAGTHDVLDIAAFNFADFNAVLTASTQVNDGVVIALDADDSVTLLGVQLSNLHQGDFLLV
jgi:hypothetical protein